ncbi:hypothetical protein GF362_02210 [Candidatus Dojkabacteria bacterium]|nr:hypothetical protein [Candidatus Dojkabacteria bacterium]
MHIMLRLEERQLNESEISLLMSAIKQITSIFYIKKSMWSAYKYVYVIMKESEFIGVCVVVPFKNWKKIGPIIILNEFRDQGFGRKVFKEVIKRNRKSNLFLGSSNPKIHNIIKDFGCEYTSSFFKIPKEGKYYILKHLFKTMSWNFILEFFQKLPKRIQSEYKYFYKYGKNVN